MLPVTLPTVVAIARLRGFRRVDGLQLACQSGAVTLVSVARSTSWAAAAIAFWAPAGGLVAAIWRARTFWVMTKKRTTQPALEMEALSELTALGEAAEAAWLEADGRWWGIWSDHCHRQGQAELPVDVTALCQWTRTEGPRRWGPVTVERVVCAVLGRYEEAPYPLDGFGE